MLDDNRWQLYSSVDGWKAIEEKLEVSLSTALVNAEAAVTAGATLMRAALDAITEVGKVMRGKEAADFGACDPEPHHHLEWRVKKHFAKRYGVELQNL